MRQGFDVNIQIQKMPVCDDAQSVGRGERGQSILRAVFVDKPKKLFFPRVERVAGTRFFGEYLFSVTDFLRESVWREQKNREPHESESQNFSIHNFIIVVFCKFMPEQAPGACLMENIPSLNKCQEHLRRVGKIDSAAREKKKHLTFEML
jgi:hypothetical protein